MIVAYGLEHGIIWIALTGQKLLGIDYRRLALGYDGGRFQRIHSRQQANGLNHRSRGQRPRTKARLDDPPCKGSPNRCSLARPYRAQMTMHPKPRASPSATMVGAFSASIQFRQPNAGDRKLPPRSEETTLRVRRCNSSPITHHWFIAWAARWRKWTPCTVRFSLRFFPRVP